MKQKFYVKAAAIVAAMMFGVLNFSAANAQTWNANAGGYNGGYGQVYSTFGMAQATKNMQDTMNLTMQRTMMRMAMEKKWGKKAVAEAEAKTNRQNASATKNSVSVSDRQTPVVRNYAVFKPDASVDTGKLFADTLGETAEHKALLKQIYTATKTAFEKEAAGKGWKNNYASALVFFIATAATVYHDAPEPNDAATENLYKALNQTIDENPEFGKVPNKDKQEFYNKMIGFSGLILATYMEGKESDNAETVKTAGKLAGVLIELILKISPDKVRFEKDTFVIG